MRTVFHSIGRVFVVFNIRENQWHCKHFFKVFFVQNIVYTSIYDIIMSPEHFEIKNTDLRPL